MEGTYLKELSMRNFIGRIKFKDVHVVDMVYSQVPYTYSASSKDEGKHEEKPESWHGGHKLVLCLSQLLL